MLLLIVSYAVVLLAIGTAVRVRLRTTRRNQQRLERARIDREVHRAERRLHQMSSDAFSSMMDTAREVGGNSPWQIH